MGLGEVLTIVFVVLKLLGKIDWSWWVVLLPEIICCVVYVSLAVLYMLQKVKVKKDLDEIFKRR